MSLLLIILYCMISGPNEVFSKEIEINFIRDFLNTEFHAVQVNAFLCWDKNDTLELTKRLFEDNIRISIRTKYTESLTQYLPSPDLLFLLDSNCELSQSILFLVQTVASTNTLPPVDSWCIFKFDRLTANLQKLFASPYKWLLLSDDFKTYKTNNDLDKLDILLDSFFYLGLKMSEDKYSLNEVFKFNKSTTLVNRVIDTWANSTGFQNHSLPTILSIRRLNIMGTKIIGAAVILDNSTFDHLYDYREKHKDSITKLNLKLVNIMIEYFNGTKGFEYYDSWGYKKPSEKFYTGMIGAMQNGDAEIGCTSMFVNTERLQATDYLSWTTPTAIQFIYKQPPLSYVTNLFTLPFSQRVWYSIVGLFFISVLFIYLVAVWERRNLDERKEEDDSFLEIIMLAVGAVCQQGTTYEPKSGTGKIMTFLIFIALLFIYVSYSAYIVVLLQSTSDQIQTLEDLLDSKMDYGLTDLPYNHFYFQNATEPIRKAIYENKIMPKGEKVFMTLEEGLKRVREGFFAFHGETPPMYTIIGKTFFESEKCGIQNMQYIEASQFWLPCKKKSSYKEIFKVCLRKLAEFGIQSRESNRLFDEKPRCLGGGSNFVSVGLVDAGPAFAFLGAGFGVAVFLFLLEHAVHKATWCKVHTIRKKSR